MLLGFGNFVPLFISWQGQLCLLQNSLDIYFLCLRFLLEKHNITCILCTNMWVCLFFFPLTLRIVKSQNGFTIYWWYTWLLEWLIAEMFRSSNQNTIGMGMELANIVQTVTAILCVCRQNQSCAGLLKAVMFIKLYLFDWCWLQIQMSSIIQVMSDFYCSAF